MPAPTRSAGTSPNDHDLTVSRATMYRTLRRARPDQTRTEETSTLVLHPLPSRPAQRDVAGRLHPLAARRRQRRRDPLLDRRPLPLRHLGHRPPPRHRPHRRRHVHQRPGRPRHPRIHVDRQRDGVHHPTVRRPRRPQRLRTPPRQPRHHPEEHPAEPPDHLRQSRTLPPNPQTLAHRPPRPGHDRRAPDTCSTSSSTSTTSTDPTAHSTDRTPTAAYHARPKATPAGIHQPHYRVRRDRVSHGNVSLRVHGRLHHIGLGRHLHGTPIIMLIDDLDVRVIHATTGEIIRQPHHRPDPPLPRHRSPHRRTTTTLRTPKNETSRTLNGGSAVRMSRDITRRPRQDSNLRHTV